MVIDIVDTPVPTVLTLAPLPELLSEYTIVETHYLKFLNTWNGGSNLYFRTESGFIIEEGDSRWDNFDDYYITELQEGEAVILRLEYDPLSLIRLFVESEYQDEYLRWGVIPGYYPKTYIRQGKKEPDWNYLRGNLLPQPNQVYDVLLAIDDPGNFRCVFWDPNKPDSRIEVKQQMPTQWANRKWNLEIRVQKGRLNILNFTRISFWDFR
jgi:hypothetical protein